MFAVEERSESHLRIGELSKRTGISPELLRAWERRYGLLKPARSPGGFRLYSGADEARVRRMQAHLARGVAAAEAARLADRAWAEGGPTGSTEALRSDLGREKRRLPLEQAAERRRRLGVCREKHTP